MVLAEPSAIPSPTFASVFAACVLTSVAAADCAVAVVVWVWVVTALTTCCPTCSVNITFASPAAFVMADVASAPPCSREICSLVDFLIWAETSLSFTFCIRRRLIYSCVICTVCFIIELIMSPMAALNASRPASASSVIVAKACPAAVPKSSNGL